MRNSIEKQKMLEVIDPFWDVIKAFLSNFSSLLLSFTPMRKSATSEILT